MAQLKKAAALGMMLLHGACGFFWDDSALNKTCAWLTPEPTEGKVLTWERKWNWKSVLKHLKEPEQEPDDIPSRQKPACYVVRLKGSEMWHYESKGHVYKVSRNADACCLRQEDVLREAPAIVSFKPLGRFGVFTFCECEGVDPLKPDTFCAGMAEESLVCPIGSNTTDATCSDTSALEHQPAGCDGNFPPETGGDAWWVPVENLSMDRACRRSSPFDLSESYYGKFFCTDSLEDCKDHCARTAGCKGIEFTNSSGRCETWFADINATYENFGVQCLRYEGPSAPVTNTYFTMHPDGENRACRGSSESDNSVCYYSVHNNGAKVSALTLEECMERCRKVQGCKGIEYKEASGYCEVWTEEIMATFPVAGYSCYLAGNSSDVILP